MNESWKKTQNKTDYYGQKRKEGRPPRHNVGDVIMVFKAAIME